MKARFYMRNPETGGRPLKYDSPTVPIGITLPQDLLDEIDDLRGQESRSSWITRAIIESIDTLSD